MVGFPACSCRSYFCSIKKSAASRVIPAKRNCIDPAMAGKVFYVNRNWGWLCDIIELAMPHNDQL
jgi:hypothetical protein